VTLALLLATVSIRRAVEFSVFLTTISVVSVLLCCSSFAMSNVEVAFPDFLLSSLVSR
jgi:hypothetical protein